MTWRGLTGRQQRALDLLAELADEHGQAGPDGEPTVTLARWRGGLVTRDVLGVTRRDMRIAVSVSVSVSVLNSLPIFHFRNARHFGSRGALEASGAIGHLHLSYGDVRAKLAGVTKLGDSAAAPEDTFLDLYAALVSVAGIGINVLGQT